MADPLATASQNFNLNALARAQSNLVRFGEQLASGFRVNRAADDAASLAIGTRLATDSAAFQAVQANTGLGTSALNTADGALSNVSNLLIRANTLAVQAGSSFLSDADRANLNTEFQSILDEVDRIAGDTEFNGVNLLGGPGTQDFTVRAGTGIVPGEDNIDISIDPATTTDLSINTLDISTQAGADAAVTGLSSAIDNIIGNRADIGAGVNRLEAAEDFAATQEVFTEQARSELLDLDVATGITAFQQAQDLNRLGIETLGLQNRNRGALLNLLA